MNGLTYDKNGCSLQGCHLGLGARDFPRLLQVWALPTLIQDENIGKRKMHQITK